MSSLLVRLRQMVGSASLQAVVMLMGGNVVATALPILAAPILGRIYAPAEYGALAQYMAPAAVLAVLASLQFQHAIIAERTDRSAGQVTWLPLLGGLAGAILTAGMVAVLWHPLLAGSEAGAWFWLLPLTVASAGVIAAGSSLANRHCRYGWMARLQMSHVLTVVAFSMAFGILGWGADGLLAAYFMGQLVQMIAYLWLLHDLRASILPWPRAKRLRVLVRRHRKFPVFTLPSGFADQVNQQAPVFALTAVGADATLGAFTRARQLVSIPVMVVGASVTQVFMREASKVYHETGSCRRLMLHTAGGLFAAGLLPCVVFMTLAPWLFEVYLGPSWREAGEIARILAPMLLLKVTVSPIATIYYIAGRQIEDFVLMLVSSAVMALCMVAAIYGFGKSEAIIATFASVFAVIYVVYIIRSFIIGGRTTS